MIKELKKMINKIIKMLKFLRSELFITATIILAQLVLLVSIFLFLNEYYLYIYIINLIVGLVLVVRIINRDMAPSLKLPWLIVVLTIPVAGNLLYLIIGENRIKRRFLHNSVQITKHLEDILKQDNIAFKELKEDDIAIEQQAKYLMDYALAPIYKDTNTDYLKIGEEYWEKLLNDLRKAEKFIFLEFFIVEDGVMLESILDILYEKAANGVEIRFMYDHMGCIQTLPRKFNKTLIEKGIAVQAFNRFTPVVSMAHNNRDHRKICVIDGYIGYTGGINIADEYVNIRERFGHWKDTGIRLEGKGVRSLTCMFLSMWNSNINSDESYRKYTTTKLIKKSYKENGYVIPFGDSPLDNELTSQIAYMNILNSAKEYVYIYTPYFIVDYNLLFCLQQCAKKGVDVRIITPHIPDKSYVHAVTRSNYKYLIEFGIKVYEYEPGFVHAKCIISDDKVGIVGTINLDYRSLVHHFECGVWMYKTDALAELKKDFLDTQKQSIHISMEECLSIKWYVRWYRGLLQFFGSLL